MPHILIIDDDESYRDYLTALLARSGHTVRALPHAKQLRRIIETERFDVVITDLYMPEVDGIEILLGIREVVPAMPVIGITGGYALCSRAMEALGADAVLQKPLDVDELQAALQRALDKSRAAQSEASQGKDPEPFS
jgi:DNA-binding NtrC family response regulator